MLLMMMQRPQGYSAGGFVTLGFKVFADVSYSKIRLPPITLKSLQQFLKQAYYYLVILRNLM